MMEEGVINLFIYLNPLLWLPEGQDHGERSASDNVIGLVVPPGSDGAKP